MIPVHSEANSFPPPNLRSNSCEEQQFFRAVPMKTSRKSTQERSNPPSERSENKPISAPADGTPESTMSFSMQTKIMTRRFIFQVQIIQMKQKLHHITSFRSSSTLLARTRKEKLKEKRSGASSFIFFSRSHWRTVEPSVVHNERRTTHNTNKKYNIKKGK